jgi:hypothetical protein
MRTYHTSISCMPPSHVHLLDEFFGLDIVHTMDTRNTVTINRSALSIFCWIPMSLPDGENTASLGKVGLLLNTTDSLLQDGGDFGGCCL